MRDIPRYSIKEVHKILADTGISEATLIAQIDSMEKIKGFNKVSVEEQSGLRFLSEAQLLMLSCKYTVKVRMALVKSLLELSESNEIIEDVIKASIHRKRHRYQVFRNTYKTLRPLVNLIGSNMDNETCDLTHFLLTETCNRMRRVETSCSKLKVELQQCGLLDKNFKPSPHSGIRVVRNYIELPFERGKDTEYKTIVVEGLVYDATTVNKIMSILLEIDTNV